VLLFRLSLATDRGYCRRHDFNSTQRMQHEPGTGCKTLATFLPGSPGRTIEYCDSPYHILATSVNTQLRATPEACYPPFGTALPCPHSFQQNQTGGQADFLSFWLGLRLLEIQGMTRTIRPETCPLRNRSSAWLASDSGLVLTRQRTFPAAARVRTSRISCRVPTEEA
jgi:hypothetical protein